MHQWMRSRRLGAKTGPWTRQIVFDKETSSHRRQSPVIILDRPACVLSMQKIVHQLSIDHIERDRAGFQRMRVNCRRERVPSRVLGLVNDCTTRMGVLLVSTRGHRTIHCREKRTELGNETEYSHNSSESGLLANCSRLSSLS